MQRATRLALTVSLLAIGGCACSPDPDPDAARLDAPGSDAPGIDAPLDTSSADVPAMDVPSVDATGTDVPRMDAPGLAPHCDPDHVLCESLPPDCEDGEAPSVVGSCWGECIPVSECRCDTTEDCPDIPGYSEVCYTAGHCGPLL